MMPIDADRALATAIRSNPFSSAQSGADRTLIKRKLDTTEPDLKPSKPLGGRAMDTFSTPTLRLAVADGELILGGVAFRGRLRWELDWTVHLLVRKL